VRLTSRPVHFTPGTSRSLFIGPWRTSASHGLMLVRDSMSRCTSDLPLTVTCYILTLTFQPHRTTYGASFQVLSDGRAYSWHVTSVLHRFLENLNITWPDVGDSMSQYASDLPLTVTCYKYIYIYTYIYVADIPISCIMSSRQH
jgi:hypothetical protein